MSRNAHGRTGLLACAAWLVAVAGELNAASPAIAPPNIVLIQADDLGSADLGCYGAAYHRTPHLDQLARDGMRFTQAYAAAPACTPSRAGLLTGHYPARLHVTGQPSFRNDPPTRQFLHPDFRTALPANVPTLAERLAAAGYISASFGKWGFDNAATTKGFAVASDPGATVDAAQLTDLGVGFIRKSARDRFWLYLNHHLVHEPLRPKLEPARLTRIEEEFRRSGRKQNPAYAATVEKLDEEVGRLLAVLADAGLAERTLIIFVSDNGGFLGTDRESFTSNAPLHEGKSSLYEGGIRVPLIVRWPGIVGAGATCDVPVINMDFLPTLLEVIGQPVSATPSLDGRSFLPLLRGATSAPARSLYWHFPHYRRAMASIKASPASAVRDGDWKLLHFYEDDHIELYNLRDDPGETHNLASTQSDRATRLRRQLDSWRDAADAQPPIPNPKFVAPAHK